MPEASEWKDKPYVYLFIGYFSPYVTVMGLDQLFDDGQADPCASVFTGA